MTFEQKMQYIETMHKLGLHPDLIISTLALLESNNEYDLIGKNIMQAANNINAIKKINEGVKNEEERINA
jgi:hypothetical protein